jgi:anti-anti-sigma factor
MTAAALPFALRGELTIPHAAQHRAELLAAVQQARELGKPLALDLAAVDTFDSAGLQLLMATRRSLQAAGLALQLSAVSGAVQDLFHVYGLQGWPQKHGAQEAA